MAALASIPLRSAPALEALLALALLAAAIACLRRARKRRARGSAGAAAALLLCALAAGALAWRTLEVERRTAVLDRAPRELVVPAYFDPVFFQGQGFPVHTDHVAAGERRLGGVRLFVLPHFDQGIDYKNLQENEAQVRRVNALYRPDPPWRADPARRRGHYKCLSTSASLVVDWFALERGAELPSYESILDGARYRGMDPKALDSLYCRAHEADPELFKLTDSDHLDPITSVRVPYSAAGFAALIERESRDPAPRGVRDPALDVEYACDFGACGPLRSVPLLSGKVFWSVARGAYPREESERLRAALQRYGPLLAGIKVRFSTLHGIFDDTRAGDLPIQGLTGHGVVIAGWLEKDGYLYFLYRETFGRYNEERPEGGPAWRIYPIYGFNEVFAFERG